MKLFLRPSTHGITGDLCYGANDRPRVAHVMPLLGAKKGLGKLNAMMIDKMS